MARPSNYSHELAAEIAYRMIEGNKSLKGIEADEDMPSVRTMIRWCIDHPEFNVVLAQARMIKADAYVEDAVPIADEQVADLAQAARNRLRVQARLDAAAKLWPAKYSAKLNMNIAQGGVEMPQVQQEPMSQFELARRIAWALEAGRRAMQAKTASEPPRLSYIPIRDASA